MKKDICTFEFFAFTLRILPLWFDENATVTYVRTTRQQEVRP